jgi:hypothetical protein
MDSSIEGGGGDIWLGVGIFNVTNKKDSQGKKADAQDYRNLMAILVDLSQKALMC